MKTIGIAVSFCLLVITVAAADINFSGGWTLNPSKSTNLGMMAAMQLVETIKQSGDTLTILDNATMNGQIQTNEIHYDLKGKPGSNEDFMGQKNETVSKWTGGKLVTTWTTDGAVAGTKIVRSETRSLSSDGKTMTVESVRGTSAAIIMVFDKK